jgi:hypothetical protein
MKKVMKNKNVTAMMVVVVLAVAFVASGVVASPPMFGDDPPVASTINYQGHLTDSGGNPLDGTYDMEFRFYDSATGGSQVGSTITKNDVTVTNGLFSVKLDVSQSGFYGQGSWLEVKVEGETLSPRQEILPVPYAMSLKPGAVIDGEEDFGAMLSVFNSGWGNAYGVYGEAWNADDVQNIGGYFVAGGSEGTGVYGYASNTADAINYGGFFHASGVQGRGVFGEAEGDSGIGVKGWASDDGLNVQNYGGHFTASGGHGVGVYGLGTAQGGYFESTASGGNGVRAVASGSTSTGVYGESSGSGGTCTGGFFRTFSPGRSSAGVHGDAWADGDDVENYGGSFCAMGGKGRGVFGYATNEGDVTNYGGYFLSYGRQGVGVYAEATGTSGTGIYAKGGQNGYAADFKGNVIIRSSYTNDPVVELGQGLDYAEGFDVSGKKDIGPGSVLIIDPANPGKLTISDRAYDSKVAGIVAGAKEFGSGVRLGGDQFDYDVALAGRVYCNVDATEAAVEPGDLLTTSAIPGYAMKVTDYELAQGAILGKAMEGLEKGQMGQILVLVTLQ